MGAPLRARPRAAAALVALPLAVVGCALPNPARDAALGQTVFELGEAVTALRFEVGVMQDQVDSLRTVVARQDSALARLARAGGAP